MILVTNFRIITTALLLQLHKQQICVLIEKRKTNDRCQIFIGNRECCLITMDEYHFHSLSKCSLAEPNLCRGKATRPEDIEGSSEYLFVNCKSFTIVNRKARLP